MTRPTDEALEEVRHRAAAMRRRRWSRSTGVAALLLAVIGVTLATTRHDSKPMKVVAGSTGTTVEPSTSTTLTSVTTEPPTTTPPPVATGTGRDRDLQVEVRATPSPGPAVSPVQFDIVAKGMRVDLEHAVTMTFGDGSFDGYGAAAGCAPPPPSQPGSTTTEPPSPPAATGTIERSHAYRGPGTFHVSVDVVSGYSCFATSWARRVTVKLDVRVSDGPKVTNGPQPPSKPDLIEQYPRDGASFVTANVNDPDGYVRKLVYDWGDGTAPVDVGLVADRPCQDSPTQWPSSQAFTGIGHHYARNGTYRVTVTVVSTGCGGKDEQRNSNAIEISWPSTAPAPPTPPASP